MKNKKFTLEIHGLGFEYGVGKITKTQYNYWSDREDEIHVALNNYFYYEENKTPKAARLKEYYNEYSDVASYSGPLSDHSTFKVLNDSGCVVFEMEFNEITNKIDEDGGDVDDFSECEDEFQSNNSFAVKGYFIKWRLNGNGIYFRGEIEDEEFSMRKLKVITFDVDNDYFIKKIFYNGKSILDIGGEWQYGSPDYEVGFND